MYDFQERFNKFKTKFENCEQISDKEKVEFMFIVYGIVN